MHKIFCSECGTKHEYSASKPKFCSECGSSMTGGVSARKEKQDDYEDDGEIPSPSSIAVKLYSDRPQGIKFGEIAEQGIAPSEKLRRGSPRIGVQDLIERSTKGNKIVID